LKFESTQIRFLLIVIFFVLFTQALFASVFYNAIFYSDEIILLISLVLLLPIILFRKKIVFIKGIIPLLYIFFTLGLIGVLISNTNLNSFILCIFNYLKPFLFLFVFINLLHNRYAIKNNIFKCLDYVVIFLCFYSFLQEYLYLKYSINLPTSVMPRSGIGRVSAISGHPISWSITLVPFILRYYMQRRFIFFVIALLSLGLSVTRLPLFITFLSLTVFMFFEKSFKGKFLFAIIGFVLISFSFNYMFTHKTEYDRLNIIENFKTSTSLRMYSINKAIEIFEDNPIIGLGIGKFGTKQSANYHPEVYKKYNFNPGIIERIGKMSSGIDSFISQLFVETGIVGGSIIFLIFFYLFKYIKKDDLELLNKTLLVQLLLVSMFYPFYTIPFTIYVFFSITNDTNISILKL